MTSDSSTVPALSSSAEISARTGFAINRLNRHSERREIEAELVALRSNPAARTYVIVGDIPLLKSGSDPARARFKLAEAHALSAAPPLETAYLGTLDDTPLFAMLFPQSLAEQLATRDDVALIGLRDIGSQELLPPGEVGPLGEAKAMMDWHRRHGFCANCGTATVAFTGGFRRDCPSCGAHHFPRVDPAVIMLVVDGDNCLLGRQPNFPQGRYSCLAGFVEPGETMEDAVRREVQEEAGIRTGRVRYLGSQPWPFPSSLMFGCVAEAIDTQLVVDMIELEHARWFSREEVRLMFEGTHPEALRVPQPFAIAYHLLQAFITAEGPFFPPESFP